MSFDEFVCPIKPTILGVTDCGVSWVFRFEFETPNPNWLSFLFISCINSSLFE